MIKNILNDSLLIIRANVSIKSTSYTCEKSCTIKLTLYLMTHLFSSFLTLNTHLHPTAFYSSDNSSIVYTQCSHIFVNSLSIASLQWLLCTKLMITSLYDSGSTTLSQLLIVNISCLSCTNFWETPLCVSDLTTLSLLLVAISYTNSQVTSLYDSDLITLSQSLLVVINTLISDFSCVVWFATSHKHAVTIVLTLYEQWISVLDPSLRLMHEAALLTRSTSVFLI